MKCFFHASDFDGQCSAAIIKHAHPECELIGLEYDGSEFPWGIVKPKEIVFMVDFSLQPIQKMIALKDRAHLIWIDHHQSAIEDAKRMGLDKIQGIRQNGIAGCELTWGYVFPELELPTAVFYLGRYDVWQHNSDANIIPFQYGMKLQDTDPNNQWLWKLLFNNDQTLIEHVLSNGKIIWEYQKKEWAAEVKRKSFELSFEGLRLIAINGGKGSQQFDSIWDPSKYDAMMTFRWDKGTWMISLYTIKPDIDLSLIAKKYGGGGHKGASGFECKDLPFTLK